MLVQLLQIVFVTAARRLNYTQIRTEYLAADSLVRHVNETSFGSLVSAGHAVVFFGADWCVHCQVLTPVWLHIQRTHTHPALAVAKVECLHSAELCRDIEVFPLLRHYSPDGSFVDAAPEVRDSFEDLSAWVSSILANITADSQDPVKHALSQIAQVALTDTATTEHNVTHIVSLDAYTALTHDTEHIIMFHAPWCSHCLQFAPSLQTIANTLKNTVAVAKVDCTAKQNKPICAKYHIRGFPTLAWVVGDLFVEFEGSREVNDIVLWARDLKRYFSFSNCILYNLTIDYLYYSSVLTLLLQSSVLLKYIGFITAVICITQVYWVYYCSHLYYSSILGLLLQSSVLLNHLLIRNSILTIANQH